MRIAFLFGKLAERVRLFLSPCQIFFFNSGRKGSKCLVDSGYSKVSDVFFFHVRLKSSLGEFLGVFYCLFCRNKMLILIIQIGLRNEKGLKKAGEANAATTPH